MRAPARALSALAPRPKLGLVGPDCEILLRAGLLSKWTHACDPRSVLSVMPASKRTCAYGEGLGFPLDLRRTTREQLASCASAKSGPQKRRT